MRSGVARFLLPFAEMLEVCQDDPCRLEGFARTDLRFWHRVRADTRQQDQNDAQPECQTEKEPHHLVSVFARRRRKRRRLLSVQREVAVAKSGCGLVSEIQLLRLDWDWHCQARHPASQRWERRAELCRVAPGCARRSLKNG